MKKRLQRISMRYVATMLVAITATAAVQFDVSADTIKTNLLRDVCAGSAQPDAKSERFHARLQSICKVWYPDSFLPVPRTIDDIAASCQDFAGTAVDDFVNQSLLDEPLLCWYATLDKDRDGILDLRLSNDGFFSENDPDIDNDDIPNHRDLTVVKANREQPHNGCLNHRIPAAFNWADIVQDFGQGAFYKAYNAKDCSGADKKLCDIQQRLFSNYDVLVYERGGRFNLKTLHAIEDVITRVFGSKFIPQTDSCKSLPTIKSVAVAPCADMTEDPNQPCATEQTTMGLAYAHNASMTLFDEGTKATSMDLLSLLAHEFAHSWQFAMDAENPDASRHLMKNVWVTPNFDAYLREKNWRIEYKPDVQFREDSAKNSLLVFSETDVVAHDKLAYQYSDYPLMLLNKDLVTVGLHSGYDLGAHASADRLAKAAVIGEYSLSDPWEWHADSVAAYVLLSIEEHLKENSTDDLGERAANRLARLQRDGWGDSFYYRNLHPELKAVLSQELPISRSDLDVLTCRYVVYSDDYVFNSAKETHEEDSLYQGQIIELGQLLRDDWAARCLAAW